MKFLTVFALFFVIHMINGQQVQQNQQQIPVNRVQVVGVQGAHDPNQVLEQNVVSNSQNAQQHVVQHDIKETVVNQIKPNNKHRMVRALINRINAQKPYKVEDIPSKCNYICDQAIRSICGFNGLCHREFESQCDLNTYNCINTQKIFHIVDDISCMDETTVKCYRGDM